MKASLLLAILLTTLHACTGGHAGFVNGPDAATTSGGGTTGGGPSPTPSPLPPPGDHNAVATLTISGTQAVLLNGLVQLRCDTAKATCDLGDLTHGSVVVSGATWRVGSVAANAAGAQSIATSNNANDALGTGKTLRITTSQPGNPSLIWEATLYTGLPYVVLAVGVDNVTSSPIRVNDLHPWVGGILNPNQVVDHPMTLNGPSGGQETLVLPGLSRLVPNNLALTWQDANQARRSMVLGGLTHHEWFKRVNLAAVGAPDVAAARQASLSALQAAGRRSVGLPRLRLRRDLRAGHRWCEHHPNPGRPIPVQRFRRPPGAVQHRGGWQCRALSV